MIKAIIFDGGNVLHSLKDTGTKDEVLLNFTSGIKPTKEVKVYFEEQLSKLGSGKLTEKEFWNKLSKKLNITLPANYKDLWRKKFRKNATAYIEIFELIDQLKILGYKVYILSNTIPPHLEIIKQNGWYKPFDKVFLSCVIKMRKPDKSIYYYVLDNINLNPTETVFIDDLKENITTAKEIGMNTILAISPKQVVEDLLNFLEINK